MTVSTASFGKTALGFITVSDEYLEEGVVHVDMEMPL